MEKTLRYILSGFVLLIGLSIGLFLLTKTENSLWKAQLSMPTTYYIDNATGNDANTGTSTDQAWKTIAKVNNSTFLPGDQILFKRGGVWREQLSIPSSGLPGSNIVFGAYGTGVNPIITGANTISNWTLSSGNIYVADVGALTTPNQLYIDGVYYDIAHYPNSGYLLATANSPEDNSIIDSNLNLSGEQIVGATVVARPITWFLYSYIATAYNSTTHKITLNRSFYVPMKAGLGFYLQNKLWMLDSAKEWYYDSVAGKIYLWTASGDNPNSHTVEVSSRQYGIFNSGKNYITIKDLTVSNAIQNNINFNNANGINASNLNISGGLNGMYFTGISNSSINNNSVQNTLANGIQVDKVNNNIDISNNIVNNAGNTGSMPHNSIAGIVAAGQSINIKNNTVTNSGYIGIDFGGSSVTVQNNKIDRSCLVLDDCGGIYTSGGGNNTIIGNTVTNSIGHNPPTDGSGVGIYLDSLTHNTSVLNNTVSNTDYGIYIHTGWDNTVTGNSVYNSRISGLLLNESGSSCGSTACTPGTAHNNVVAENIFEAIGTEATAKYYSDIVGSNTNFGSLSNNKYCHPNTNNVVFAYSNPGTGFIYTHYTLSAWQNTSGQDITSTDTKSSCSGENPPPPIVICTPNWSCGSWSTCADSQQARTCTDSNDCGVTTGRPATSQSCTNACSPDWSCGSWTTCADSRQTRTCTDSNSCGTTVGRPATSQSCTNPTPPAAEPDIVPTAPKRNSYCNSNWQCYDQGTCENSKQVKKCVDLNKCSVSKIIKVSCGSETATRLSPALVIENETPSGSAFFAPENELNFFDFLIDAIKRFFLAIF